MRLLKILPAALALALAAPFSTLAIATPTEIDLSHQLDEERAERLEKLVERFNGAQQKEYQVRLVRRVQGDAPKDLNLAFVCEANFGVVTFGSTTVCEGSSSEEVFVTGDNTDGYSTVLVINQGVDLTIVNIVSQGSIDFAGLAPGDYTIDAFNYLDTDLPAIIEAIETGGVTTGAQVASLIIEGLSICAALDVDGVVFTVLPIGDPACTPFVCEAGFGDVNTGSTNVCEGGSSDAVFVTGDNSDGYSTVLVITQGVDLNIIGIVGQGSIDFAGFAPGNYTVHAFNYSIPIYLLF